MPTQSEKHTLFQTRMVKIYTPFTFQTKPTCTQGYLGEGQCKRLKRTATTYTVHGSRVYVLISRSKEKQNCHIIGLVQGCDSLSHFSGFTIMISQTLTSIFINLIQASFATVVAGERRHISGCCLSPPRQAETSDSQKYLCVCRLLYLSGVERNMFDLYWLKVSKRRDKMFLRISLA